MRTLNVCFAICLATLTTIASISPVSASAQETVLHNFLGDPDGYFPFGTLISDKSGNLYGTTYSGGTDNSGTVFELIRPAKSTESWTETVLYSFTGYADGGNPSGGLVFDKSGNLYGTTYTSYFSSFGGTVFELSPPSSEGNPWTLTTLFDFAHSSSAVGLDPNGSLAIDSNGNLFGVAAAGGAGQASYCGDLGCGSVFELQPPASLGGKWTLIDIHDSLVTIPDGIAPNSIVVGPDGVLYGTTQTDVGYHGSGTIFRMTPSSSGSWTYKTVYSFSGNTGDGDGTNPIGLTVDPHAGLVGTTEYSTIGDQHGTVFLFAPTSSGGTESVLYTFAGGNDGDRPQGGITLDAKGNLYGTTANGGSAGNGTVFKLTLSGSTWSKTTLYDFGGGTDGSSPVTNMLLRGGLLYGVTGFGGSSSSGTVFSVVP